MVSRKDWLSQGFIGPVDLQLSAAEIAAISKEYETWKCDSNASRFKCHLILPAINRYLVRNEKLIQIVQELLATENILCWSTDWNIKYAGKGGVYLPHQDSTYAGLSPPNKVLTVWIAISDPVFELDGCLHFWSGSHKLGQLEHTTNGDKASNNLLAHNQRCDPPDSQPPISICLRAGQATIHSFYTVHASGVNRNNQDRVGFAIRYMAADVKQTGRIRECVTLISGCLEHQGFGLEPILPQDPSKIELARGRLAQLESLRRERLNYFANG